MKILFAGNAPWAGTGYSEQIKLFAPRIRDDGHTVALYANWGFAGGGGDWEGMRVYPADPAWGNHRLKSFAAHFRDGDGEDCLTLTLCDVWVLDPAKMPGRMACWCPVDHDPVPPAVRDFFARSGARPIAMSRFGEAELERCGFDPLYVPHAVDTTVFAPRADRLDVREEFGLPRDAFVAGMVAANKGVPLSRKAFPQVFQAFAQFRETHRDAVLYLHTDVNGGHGEGLNLRALQRACGIPSAAVFSTETLLYELVCDRESLAAIYATFDVLANPSFGEGFGVPIVEAQACGVPAIVTDHSAMTELVGPGWLVDGDPWYNAGQGSFYKCPAVGEIVEALEAAYDEAEGKRAAARRFAEEYDVDRVMRDSWRPALEALEQRELEAVAA